MATGAGAKVTAEDLAAGIACRRWRHGHGITAEAGAREQSEESGGGSPGARRRETRSIRPGLLFPAVGSAGPCTPLHTTPAPEDGHTTTSKVFRIPKPLIVIWVLRLPAATSSLKRSALQAGVANSVLDADMPKGSLAENAYPAPSFTRR